MCLAFGYLWWVSLGSPPSCAPVKASVANALEVARVEKHQVHAFHDWIIWTVLSEDMGHCGDG